jgi:alpha/beta superfamily hydrolase
LTGKEDVEIEAMSVRIAAPHSGYVSKIVVDGVGTVSALWSKPREAVACFVFAHGAGAGMTHPFMETVATGVVERNIATLRYQFRTWKGGVGGQTDRRWLMQRCVRPS